ARSRDGYSATMSARTTGSPAQVSRIASWEAVCNDCPKTACVAGYIHVPACTPRDIDRGRTIKADNDRLCVSHEKVIGGLDGNVATFGNDVAFQSYVRGKDKGLTRFERTAHDTEGICCEFSTRLCLSHIDSRDSAPTNSGNIAEYYIVWGNYSDVARFA